MRMKDGKDSMVRSASLGDPAGRNVYSRPMPPGKAGLRVQLLSPTSNPTPPPSPAVPNGEEMENGSPPSFEESVASDDRSYHPMMPTKMDRRIEALDAVMKRANRYRYAKDPPSVTKPSTSTVPITTLPSPSPSDRAMRRSASHEPRVSYSPSNGSLRKSSFYSAATTNGSTFATPPPGLNETVVPKKPKTPSAVFQSKTKGAGTAHIDAMSHLSGPNPSSAAWNTVNKNDLRPSASFKSGIRGPGLGHMADKSHEASPADGRMYTSFKSLEAQQTQMLHPNRKVSKASSAVFASRVPGPGTGHVPSTSPVPFRELRQSPGMGSVKTINESPAFRSRSAGPGMGHLAGINKSSKSSFSTGHMPGTEVGEMKRNFGHSFKSTVPRCTYQKPSIEYEATPISYSKRTTGMGDVKDRRPSSIFRSKTSRCDSYIRKTAGSHLPVGRGIYQEMGD
eukprot:TRINITY_DN1362_c3_g1_i1.p1 TRINITY_DN1362_c3_g1~~TRINITY_DN1362_c3_g1_i1.p1  ORF type:complete len:451 (+),score=55.28 TRINITY_DN1362_c3_g1_i1:45-1397(+)